MKNIRNMTSLEPNQLNLAGRHKVFSLVYIVSYIII